MLIVTASFTARPDTIDEVLALSLEHVERSREEPGCIAHAVHRDAEDTLRVVFLEQWEDAEALRTHLRVPAARSFGKEATALAAAPPEMTIYEAQAATL